MGIRIHPNWCDRGVGTRALKATIGRFAEAGIDRFRLDVAEPNARAIRCYEKVGFSPAERFDRDGVPFVWVELRSVPQCSTEDQV